MEITTKQWSATCLKNHHFVPHDRHRQEAIGLSKIWKHKKSWWCTSLVNRTVSFGNMVLKLLKWQFSTLFLCSTVHLEASFLALDDVLAKVLYSDSPGVSLQFQLLWAFWHVAQMCLKEHCCLEQFPLFHETQICCNVSTRLRGRWGAATTTDGAGWSCCWRGANAHWEDVWSHSWQRLHRVPPVFRWPTMVAASVPKCSRTGVGL